jgi:hypothetical protein
VCVCCAHGGPDYTHILGVCVCVRVCVCVCVLCSQGTRPGPALMPDRYQSEKNTHRTHTHRPHTQNTHTHTCYSCVCVVLTGDLIHIYWVCAYVCVCCAHRGPGQVRPWCPIGIKVRRTHKQNKYTEHTRRPHTQNTHTDTCYSCVCVVLTGDLTIHIYWVCAYVCVCCAHRGPGQVRPWCPK